jgi:hypothetical protein
MATLPKGFSRVRGKNDSEVDVKKWFGAVLQMTS